MTNTKYRVTSLYRVAQPGTVCLTCNDKQVQSLAVQLVAAAIWRQRAIRRTLRLLNVHTLVVCVALGQKGTPPSGTQILPEPLRRSNWVRGFALLPKNLLESPGYPRLSLC